MIKDTKIIIWQSIVTAGMVDHIAHEDVPILIKELDDAVMRICSEWNVDGTHNSL